ncbi:MAG TPA: hypothetical protein VN597_13360, partial [Streptosporangiaceae bacterium]|nr:hypothetical protein [Streptosporangiaceae bacterium]
ETGRISTLLSEGKTMKCYQCGSDLAESAARCAGAGLSAVRGGRPRRGGECRAARPALVFRFDAARWTVADRVAGGATIMLLVLLFLPWFSVSADSATSPPARRRTR